MARILFLNSVCYGSTGAICKNLYKMAEELGHECCIAYGRGDVSQEYNSIKIGSQVDVYAHVLKARLFDASGFGSKNATKEFLKWIDEYNPDIIHLHNIHGYYINIELLFKFLKKHPNIKKIWTLHDCWPFTGHCPHFEYEGCEKWKSGCSNCPRKNEYPKTLFDNCEKNYVKKKELFSNIENMIIVTPSEWLRNLVKQSFMRDYSVYVVNNGINTQLFRKCKTDIRKRWRLEDKKIILGVASVWNKKKGLEYFYELASKIDETTKIVMIGLNKDQIKELPEKIIGIERTENVKELIEWYSVADVFFNPTLEDNYPTVNLEAQACGTPLATFDVGGTKETIKNNRGIVIYSIEDLLRFLYKEKDNMISEEQLKIYDWKNCFKEYMNLYSGDK